MMIDDYLGVCEISGGISTKHFSGGGAFGVLPNPFFLPNQFGCGLGNVPETGRSPKRSRNLRRSRNSFLLPSCVRARCLLPQMSPELSAMYFCHKISDMVGSMSEIWSSASGVDCGLNYCYKSLRNR